VTSGPLFPSDLLGSLPHAESRQLAGRVLQASPPSFVIADAFASVSASGASLSDVEVGDLVTLVGRWDGALFHVEALVFRQRAPTPRGDGDFARLVFRGVGPKLAARARALRSVRAYFEREGFVEVETPLAVPAPGVDRNIEAIRAEPGWLITSPELEMKRLLVAGIPRQFQLARVHRRDESGSLHESEFTLLEWYRAFAGQEDILRDTEALVAETVEALRGRRELLTFEGRRIDVTPPFARESVADAFRRYAGVDEVSELAATEPDRYFRLLVERVEPALARLDRPVFLLEYPSSEAALARRCENDPRFAERFELYIGGVELCNGYGELTDPVEQRRRFEAEALQRAELGQTVYPINERFLAALEAGMPPAGGNALGFDRLLMLATGARAIQDVIALPLSEI
jgi:lysyl-tRNA synthetase class 2